MSVVVVVVEESMVVVVLCGMGVGAWWWKWCIVGAWRFHRPVAAGSKSGMYHKMWYSRQSAWAIRRGFGDHKQIFQFVVGEKEGGKVIAEDSLTKLAAGCSEEEVRSWAKTRAMESRGHRVVGDGGWWLVLGCGAWSVVMRKLVAGWSSVSEAGSWEL